MSSEQVTKSPGDHPTRGLPRSALADLGNRPFGLYVHVPFCAARCGYCDFNTYTADELDGSGASVGGWLDAVRRELDLACGVLGTPPAAQTVFVGGGTPSLLGASGLAQVLDAIRGTFGLAAGAEVTTESNPESTSPEFFAGLAEAGYTRVSLGMQSAAPGVLAVLDRRHTPGRPVAAAVEARAAGIGQVSLDLIYGTPGETEDDLRGSLDAVLAAGVDHVSAYALIVEDGTALARRIRRGEVAMPDDDVAADRYELVDAVLSKAGMSWYEVSNWSVSRETRCRHNLGYWLDGDWWGVGPGAHSHVGGVRWWNVKHPARYAAALASRDGAAGGTAGSVGGAAGDSGGSPGAGAPEVGWGSPEAGREELSPAERYEERVMLGVRLADGLPLAVLDATGRAAVPGLVADGLLDGATASVGPAAAAGGSAGEGLVGPDALADGLLGPDAPADRRAVLTPRGRLLADAVVRALLGG